MQFINIIVHSVEDVNFRVHLQHEFSLLGLDDCLMVVFAYILCTNICLSVIVSCMSVALMYKR